MYDKDLVGWYLAIISSCVAQYVDIVGVHVYCKECPCKQPMWFHENIIFQVLFALFVALGKRASCGISKST